MEIPDVNYARGGNVFLAYQVFGAGPFDLVVVPGALSNIERGWEFDSWRTFYGTLASFARVLLFDKRGVGISDPLAGAPSVEERMDDVRAVMDAAGSERAALLGSLDGGAIAALFAGHLSGARCRARSHHAGRARSVGDRLPVGKQKRGGERSLDRELVGHSAGC